MPRPVKAAVIAAVLLVVGAIALGAAAQRSSHRHPSPEYGAADVKMAFARAGPPLLQVDESEAVVHFRYVPSLCGDAIALSVTVLQPGAGSFTDLELLPPAPRRTLQRRNVTAMFATRCVTTSRVSAALASLPAPTS